MIAFFCSTPYQILLAINLKLTTLKDKEADIYILNHFNNTDVMVNKVKSISIFNKVEYVDSIKFTAFFSNGRSIKVLYNKIKVFLSYKALSKEYFDFGDTIYDEVYLTYPDVVIQIAIKELYERNNSLKVIMYEDGIGGYDSSIFVNSIYKRIFNRLFGFRDIVDRYDSIMVFRPELYSSNIDIPIVKMPDILADNYILKQTINKVFDYKEDYNIIEKIIFFEQPMDSFEGLNEGIKMAADKILFEDYIIKIHPRSTTKAYDDFNKFKHNEIPWEILCLNNKIEDKVLISYYSTACFTSKIIFDKEPIIILLYNLIELPKTSIINEDILKFINKFTETYRDKSKIFIPNNLKELEGYLKKITQYEIN